MLGNIMDPSMTKRIAFLPLNLYFASAYPAIDEKKMLMDVIVQDKKTEFTMYCQK